MQVKLEQMRGVLMASFRCLLTLMTSEAYSAVYKLTDGAGKTYFSDKPPADSAAEQLGVKVNSYSARNPMDPMDFKARMS